MARGAAAGIRRACRRGRWLSGAALVGGFAVAAWWSDPQAWAAGAPGQSFGTERPQVSTSTDTARGEPRTGELGQTRVLPYPMEHVWPTAVRYLRVDRGYTIVDRDPDAGFILFDFPIGPDDRTGRGSVELFATKDASGRASANVSVSTDGGPLHLPNAIIEGLGEKLRRERGQPTAPPRPQPDAPPGGDETPKGKGKDKGKDEQEPSEPPQDDGLIVDG
ncbi:MAG: hypothetical protein IAG13_09375 [Deltaproteobacteria bacterium]|nr:hypothetical protein [Nannocystaceae bacterium]